MGIDHGLPIHGISTVAMSTIDKCQNCGLTMIKDIDYREVSLTPPEERHTKVSPNAKDLYFE
jgi:hypothetical protein